MRCVRRRPAAALAGHRRNGNAGLKPALLLRRISVTMLHKRAEANLLPGGKETNHGHEPLDASRHAVDGRLGGPRRPG
ncbi:hypothetical protein THIX_70155 [Thiomonas sp. X19]|nr:hypothetical protein THIX_70155 [Thiomonas sp. X19]